MIDARAFGAPYAHHGELIGEAFDMASLAALARVALQPGQELRGTVEGELVARFMCGLDREVSEVETCHPSSQPVQPGTGEGRNRVTRDD